MEFIAAHETRVGGKCEQSLLFVFSLKKKPFILNKFRKSVELISLDLMWYF